MSTYCGAVGGRALFVAVLLVSVALSQTAFATLGGDAPSLQADRAHLKASSLTVAHMLYSVEEMQTPSGTQIRQYVSPEGVVFAVSWQGAAPDLQQLLGPYFEQYVTGADAQHARRRGGVHIDDGDLVIDTAGHMRFVVGRAYLRSKVPQGMASDEIR